MALQQIQIAQVPELGVAAAETDQVFGFETARGAPSGVEAVVGVPAVSPAS